VKKNLIIFKVLHPLSIENSSFSITYIGKLATIANIFCCAQLFYIMCRSSTSQWIKWN